MATESLRGRALFFSPECPYPMIGGGAIRSASLFEFLSRRYVTDVITFRQPGESDPRDRFPKSRAHNIFVVDLPFHSKSVRARLGRNLSRAVRGRPPLIDRFAGFAAEIDQAISGQNYDFGLIEHFWAAPYIAQLRPRCARLFLDLHNIESAWHTTLAQSESTLAALAYRRFARVCRNLERALLPRFDRVLVTSSNDAAKVRELAAQAEPIVYPNALPCLPQPEKVERDVIVFSGNLEYQPNVSGIAYFRARVWPLVRARAPHLVWEIVGKNPGAVAHLTSGDERIHLIGPVEDAVSHIATAKAAIVPLLAGSGTRIKILEAWAGATAVVSTPLGAEGLSYRSGENLIIAGSADEFVETVVTLVNDAPLRARIGGAGRRLYEKNYVWESAWKPLEELLTPP